MTAGLEEFDIFLTKVLDAHGCMKLHLAPVRSDQLSLLGQHAPEHALPPGDRVSKVRATIKLTVREPV